MDSYYCREIIWGQVYFALGIIALSFPVIIVCNSDCRVALPTINAVTLRARGANQLSQTDRNGGQCPPYNYRQTLENYAISSGV